MKVSKKERKRTKQASRRWQTLLFLSLWLLLFQTAAYGRMPPLVAIDPPAETPAKAWTLTPDSFFAAANRLMQEALVEVKTEHEKTKTRLVRFARDALEARFHAWKMEDEALIKALQDLLIDFEIARRFQTPADEYLLTFEKSIQVRSQAFMQALTTGKLFKKRLLPPISPVSKGEAALSDAYMQEAAFDLATKQGRLKTLLWLHLLRTSPELNQAWRSHKALSEAIYGDVWAGWRAIERAAKDLPLGRMADLTNPQTAKHFRQALTMQDVSVQEGDSLESQKGITLSLFPLWGEGLKEAEGTLANIGLTLTPELLTGLFFQREETMLRLAFHAPEESDIAQLLTSIDTWRIRQQECGMPFASLLEVQALHEKKNKNGKTVEGKKLARFALAAWVLTYATMAQEIGVSAKDENADESEAPVVKRGNFTRILVAKPIYQALAMAYKKRAQAFNTLANEAISLKNLEAVAMRISRMFQLAEEVQADETVEGEESAPLPMAIENESAFMEALTYVNESALAVGFVEGAPGRFVRMRVLRASFRLKEEKTAFLPLIPVVSEQESPDEGETRKPETLTLILPRIVLEETMGVFTKEATLHLDDAYRPLQMMPRQSSPSND